MIKRLETRALGALLADSSTQEDLVAYPSTSEHEKMRHHRVQLQQSLGKIALQVDRDAAQNNVHHQQHNHEQLSGLKPQKAAVAHRVRTRAGTANMGVRPVCMASMTGYNHQQSVYRSMNNTDCPQAFSSPQVMCT